MTGNARDAEDNARLLFTLIKKHAALAIGQISGFFDVGIYWHCPCCHRSKPEMARLDKNGALLCALHWHHDHFGDYASNTLRDWLVEEFPHPGMRSRGFWGTKDMKIDEAAQPDDRFCGHDVNSHVSKSLVRFEPTLICGDCNVSEPYAKRVIGAPNYFSFAPFEISSFIVVSDNAPHKVNEATAAAVYDAAKPAMRHLGNKLTKFKALQADTDTGSFQQIGHPAVRILEKARAAMRARQNGQSKPD